MLFYILHKKNTETTYFKDLFKRKKGKAILEDSWTGLEGSRKFKLPDFKAIGT